MPIVRMPNGKVVNIADGATPEAIAAIRKENSAQPAATRTERRAAGQPRKSAEETEVARRMRLQKELETGGIRQYLPGFVNSALDTFNDATTGSQRGLSFNFDDSIAGAASAATRGAFNALREGDISEVGKEYRATRDTKRQINQQAADRSPVASTVGEVVGAMSVPLGANGALAEKGIRGAAQLAGAGKVGKALTATGNAIARSPVGRAALVSGEQGALNAVGSSDDAGLSTALHGYGAGALVGGGLAGGLRLGQRGLNIIKDSRAGSAGRTAYSRIAELLDNAGTTPAQAADDIAASVAKGGDDMVMDLSPGLRAQAAAISRKPNVPSSNALIERGEQRIQDRPARFAQKVVAEAAPGAVPKAAEVGDGAFARSQEVRGAQKAAGTADYAEGGAMDRPFTWNDRLERFFAEAPKQTRAALNAAADEVRLRRGDPEALGFKFNEAGDVEYMKVPSMRTFDYIKRGFDKQIGAALKAGDRATAQGLSSELNVLKDELVKANPKYAEILATQRDFFQKQDAVEFGQKALQRLAREPRVLARELDALPAHAKQEARIGIVDALVNMDAKANPVQQFRNLSRNPAQKKVLEFAFGGKKEFDEFSRWVDREIAAGRSDVLTAPGRQSETSRILMADEGEGGVLKSAFQGYGFGGAVGAVSNTIRSLKNLATGTSAAAQEEIAKVLMSRGEGLAKGVKAANEYTSRRAARQATRVVAAGKGGQQLVTGYVKE